MIRTDSTLRKVERMRKVLNHEEPDKIPISDFFWGSFINRWREELNLPGDADPYYHYDMDWIVTIPNMDPKIQSFVTIKEDNQEVIVKTGYRATLRKRFDFPMPEYIAWETDTIEKLEAFEFDDPFDRRRYFKEGDNQIAGVGDGFERNSPAWVETIKKLYPDFAVFGSITEVSECLVRLVGPANYLLWIGMYPDRFGKCLNRIGQFYLDCTKAQIEAADGLIDGMVIWGDVAYKENMFFHPDYWRTYFKPWVKAITELCHQYGLMVIYHGCGNVKLILDDFAEIGVDAINPLEAKAGLDVVELKKRYGTKLSWCGNNNIQVWETNDCDSIKKEVLRKLNAAKGGGYLPQSDHSVTSSVSGKSYDFIMQLIKNYGKYPINLGEYDEKV